MLTAKRSHADREAADRGAAALFFLCPFFFLSSQLDQQIFFEHELVGAEMVLNPLRLARHILPPGLRTNIYACTTSRHAGSIQYVCRQDIVCMEAELSQLSISFLLPRHSFYYLRLYAL